LKLGIFFSYLGYNKLLRAKRNNLSLLQELIMEGLNSTNTTPVIDDYHQLPIRLKRFITELSKSIKEGLRVIIISRLKDNKLPFWRGQVEELRLTPLKRGYIEDLIKFFLPPDRPVEDELVDAIWE